MSGTLRPVPASVFDLGTVSAPFSITPLRHSNIRSRLCNHCISEARSPLSRLTINKGEKGRRAALRCCVYELLFISATNRAPYVAPLSKALHLVRNGSPQPVSLEDLAQYVNFEIHRTRRLLFRQSLALKSRDVLVVDVAHEPLSELSGERLDKMLI